MHIDFIQSTLVFWIRQSYEIIALELGIHMYLIFVIASAQRGKALFPISAQAIAFLIVVISWKFRMLRGKWQMRKTRIMPMKTFAKLPSCLEHDSWSSDILLYFWTAL